MGIPKSVLNQRMKNIKVKTQGPNMEIKLWMGLNPIDYMKLGAKQQPFETATGVQAGKRSLRLAFIATTKNNSGHVFRREGRDRLPIKKQTIPIASKVQNFVERRVLVSQKFDQMFLKFLDEELEKRVKKRQAK